MAPSATTRQRPAATTATTATATATATAPSKRPSFPPNKSDEYAAEWVPPPFTIKELRDAIPAECFRRDTFKSFSYVFMDLAMIAALGVAASRFDSLAAAIFPASDLYASLVKWAVLWPAYWVMQGIVMTGVWVIAHECGHQAFSDYAWVNNSVGFVLHSLLLVPYYSWKISHSKHHKANVHMQKDQVFVPGTRSQAMKRTASGAAVAAVEAAPLVETLMILRQQLFGWPAYIVANVSGQKFDRWTSHFDPTSPIFSASQFLQIVASDIGIVGAFGLLTYFSYTFSFLDVVKYYLIPYFWVNHWLVMITFLQHTDVRVPHFTEASWDFLTGALSTVDRDYGILNHFFHHIADTHATVALKAKLGKYYLWDDTPIFLSLYRSYRDCKFVEDSGDVLWYKSK
ncbi:fatty acid desaturase-domain-containing protein [Zopfochytrium polystomum]|nr:fatty acid desaturase-domain-containing protein [Zopfochytrium polystomum]